MDAGLFILYIIVGVAVPIGVIELMILFASYRSLDKRLRDYMFTATCNDIQYTKLMTHQKESTKTTADVKLLLEYFDLEVVDAKRVVQRKQKD